MIHNLLPADFLRHSAVNAMDEDKLLFWALLALAMM